MDVYDVAIIGGGIVGSALAHELSKYRLAVVLLEREHDIAEGISKANSGVLHAGFAVPAGSLKSRLNVAGRRYFPQLTDALGVPFVHCKKLVVARTADERPQLQALLANGQQAGVPGLSIISGSQAKAIAPAVVADTALYSEDTAVVLPYLLAIALAENALLNGVRIDLNTEVTRLDRATRSAAGSAAATASATTTGPGAAGSAWAPPASTLITIEAVHTDPTTGNRSARHYTARLVINCAGLQADSVAALGQPPGPAARPVAVDSAAAAAAAAATAAVAANQAGPGPAVATDQPPTVYPWRGEYHLLAEESSQIIGTAVYPVPPKDGSGLGIHITPTVNGGALLGPSAEFIADRADTANDPAVLEQLMREAFELVPALRGTPVIKNYAGIRPKLFGADSTVRFKDFHIDWSPTLPGLVNLIGIESPGLTAAPALADYLLQRFIGPQLDPTPRAQWAYRYQPIARTRWLPAADYAALIAADAAWGDIVCHCEQVSRKAVADALANPLRALSINAVRKRTHATLGRCQSGFCLAGIASMTEAAAGSLAAVRRGNPPAALFVGRE